MKRLIQSKFFILSFALTVVMLGFGMVIPIFPFFIKEMGAGGSELGLLVASSTLAALQLAQCISDFVQDQILFSVID